MARQDYILKALEDLKLDVEKFDDKIDKKLSNIEDRMHKQEVISEKQSQSLEIYNKHLEKHMSRTEVAENRQDQYETALEFMQERVNKLEELNKASLDAVASFANWIHDQKERTKGVKQFWANIFLWIKRIGVAATTLAAVYGGYEIIQRVFTK